MIMRINQNGKSNEKGFCARQSGETEKVLQVVNLTSGSITIQASADGQTWETCKLDDGADMVFAPESESFIVRLPVANYVIQAVGDAVNDDVKIILA